MIQLVNIFNLFFLLVVNPLAAITLITRSLEKFDVTRLALLDSRLLMIVEAVGFVFYVGGFLLLGWALLTLGLNYQLGGSAPRSRDSLVTGGPYRWIRHPMYAAALSIALGLACLLQSGAFLVVFCTYLVLILFLIRMEDARMYHSYGEAYQGYQARVRRLIPFVY
jgi:protein-S-isoprenylcysteine O-methyltransferase Ste14